MSTPPPLPPASPQRSPPSSGSTTSKRGWRRVPLWGWVSIVLVVGGLIAAAVMASMAMGRLVGEGWDVFEEDARIALQRNPTIQERIGTIREMRLDFMATGNSPHPEDFVFDLEGDRGEGEVRARLESTIDGERVREGVLRMKGGGEWPLAPDPDGVED